MRKYRLLKGKHTSYNLHRIFWRFWPRRIKKVTFKGYFITEPYDIEPDRDQDDRHKLIGVPLKVFSPSNKDTALVSFQANPTEGTWDMASYFNFNKDFDSGEEIKVKPFQEFEGHIDFIEDDTAEVLIKSSGLSVQEKYTWLRTEKERTGVILPWHGGANNEPGPHGGVSPVDIEIMMEFKIYK